MAIIIKQSLMVFKKKNFFDLDEYKYFIKSQLKDLYLIESLSQKI